MCKNCLGYSCLGWITTPIQLNKLSIKMIWALMVRYHVGRVFNLFRLSICHKWQRDQARKNRILHVPIFFPLNYFARRPEWNGLSHSYKWLLERNELPFVLAVTSLYALVRCIQTHLYVHSVWHEYKPVLGWVFYQNKSDRVSLDQAKQVSGCVFVWKRKKRENCESGFRWRNPKKNWSGTQAYEKT